MSNFFIKFVVFIKLILSLSLFNFHNTHLSSAQLVRSLINLSPPYSTFLFQNFKKSKTQNKNKQTLRKKKKKVKKKKKKNR